MKEPKQRQRRLHRKKTWLDKLGGRPGLTDERHIDRSFFDRAYIAPVSSSRGPVRIYDYTGDHFGPVRVLSPTGECVRVISVDELRARPPQKALSDWVGAQETWNNRQKGLKPHVRAQDAPGEDFEG